MTTDTLPQDAATSPLDPAASSLVPAVDSQSGGGDSLPIELDEQRVVTMFAEALTVTRALRAHPDIGGGYRDELASLICAARSAYNAAAQEPKHQKKRRGRK